MATFQFVIPSQFLKLRFASDERGVNNIWNREAVRQHNELRLALRRYLFIYDRESELDIFLHGEWNSLQNKRIEFLHDRSRARFFVPQKAMAEFIRMLADKRLGFEFSTDFCGLNNLVKRNQQQLLDIMSRRNNKAETEDSRMADSLTLNTMYASRFHQFACTEVAVYRPFLAQMLTCACLLHDLDGQAEYTERLRLELTEMRKLSDTDNDVCAQIHAALSLATGNPE